MNKLESFKLITLEEFKNWEGFDKLVAQYGKKLYDDTISNYLIEGITRASLQLDSICGYRLETEFPLLDPNSEIDKKRINYVKIACCLQTQYLIRTGIEYSTGGESSSDGITSYTYPTNMKIEFSPDIISLLEKAKFYKSQTLTKINPDNYGFTNQYNNGFGKSDTNHKDRPIMLSEADAKYVWKKSMFTSNTLSIIPWSSTEKSGIWQIEISQQLLENFINNYIKNISIKLDNKSIVYNSNNALSVPFDNDTIYYENNVWKAKESKPVEVNVPLFVDEDDGSIGLLISDDFDIEENKLSLSKVWELKFTVEVVQKILEGIGKKIRWESVPIPSFKPDSANFIDIPNFSEKYRYQVRISPTNRSTAEGNLRLDPPYFKEPKENKTLSKRQTVAFIDDMDKTHYSIALYNTTGRIYLTDGNTGSNVKINSVLILRQEV